MGNDMKPLRTFRQFTAMSLVVIGALVVVRGVYYAVANNMGWHDHHYAVGHRFTSHRLGNRALALLASNKVMKSGLQSLRG
jgi:exosortase/archaeosortase